MGEFLILTALSDELEALLKKFPNYGLRQIDEETNIVFYEVKLEIVKGLDPSDIIVALLPSSGRVETSHATMQAINRWQPKFIFFIGIGGGVQDRVDLGDVMVASQILDYGDQILKSKGSGFHPNAYNVSSTLLSVTKALFNKDWVSNIEAKRPDPGTPQVRIGPLALADFAVSNTEIFERIRESNRKLIGVEIEAGGIFEAIRKTETMPEFFMIKSVSELLDGRKRDDWRKYACDIAATFSVFLIREYLITLGQDYADSKIQAPAEERDKGGVVSEQEDVKIGAGTNLNRGFISKEACLKAIDYAKAISDVLNDASGEICFAIFGHWGRGKTYLMRLTEEVLPDYYECIWFSAWKYRTKPELWAYLYESFRKKSMQSPFTLALPRRFRGNLVRIGLWPILAAILAIAMASIPLGPLLPVILSTFGIIGALRIASLYSKTWPRISGLAKQYLKAAEHGEQLGPQAVLGDDLKALLVGWFGKLSWSKSRIFISLMAYSASIIVLLCALYFGLGKETAWQLPLLGQIQLYPPRTVLFSFLCLLALTAISVPPWLLCGGRQKKRALLIVDDLDRMAPDEMLEVAESIKLFLEDEEINDLIQVVMIFEEESLRHGLLKKYGGIISVGNNVSKNEDLSTVKDTAKRIIEENMQKLFIAHLRLPHLGLEEQIEFLSSTIDYHPEIITKESQHYVEAESYDSKQSRSEDVNTKNNTEKETEEQEIYDDIKSETKAAQETLSVELSQDEKKALVEALKIIVSKENKWASLGPRAILSFVFRYKLARHLLIARGDAIRPSMVANYIAKRIIGETIEKEHLRTPAEAALHAVVEEVT